MSLRNSSGRNIFAATDKDGKNVTRDDAKYDDLKYVSKECEWFLGGVLDGLTDGKLQPV